MDTNTFRQSVEQPALVVVVLVVVVVVVVLVGWGGTLIDRRWVSEREADNYISYSSLKGQTHIAVIGIFTRQPPRCHAGRREEREQEQHRKKIGVT